MFLCSITAFYSCSIYRKLLVFTPGLRVSGKDFYLLKKQVCYLVLFNLTLLLLCHPYVSWLVVSVEVAL